jgi:hypothetical protein
MLAIGAFALLGAGVLPSLRSTFLILAATGGFGSVLLYFLTPDTLVPASVGQATYAAYRSHATALKEELGLEERSVYVPVGQETDQKDAVRLFVPQTRDWELPKHQSLRTTFVSPGQERRRGVAFTPTALTLWTEFTHGTSNIAAQPGPIANQLAEAIMEQFELAKTVETETDESARRVSVLVSDASYGAPTEFDHPLVSFIAVGLASSLKTRVDILSIEEVDSSYRAIFQYGETDTYSPADSDAESASESTSGSDSESGATG